MKYDGLISRAKRLAAIAAWAAGCWLAFKYLMPFIIAWFAACLIEPAACRLKKKRGIKRGYTAALGTVLIFGGAGMLLFIAGWQAILWLAELIKKLPEKLSEVPLILRACEDRLYGFIDAAPPEFQAFLVNAADKLNESLTGLPAQLYSKLLGIFASLVSSAPKTLMFIGASAIGTFFISSGFDEARGFLKKQAPEKVWNRLNGAAREASAALKRWAAAELALMGAAFAQLLCFFLLLRVKNAVAAAAAVALIDALPILGAGMIIVPWGLVELLSGDVKKALLLLAAYLSVSTVRSLLEPKLLGNGEGPHPAAALIAIWLGFRLAGVWGMVLFPMALLIIKRLSDSGYIRIWK